jgi:hypothetical protein
MNELVKEFENNKLDINLAAQLQTKTFEYRRDFMVQSKQIGLVVEKWPVFNRSEMVNTS